MVSSNLLQFILEEEHDVMIDDNSTILGIIIRIGNSKFIPLKARW
jgi:hypothetical protein